MATKKTETKEPKQLRTIVEQHLSACVKRANEEGITDKEFQGIYNFNNGFVLVYYR